MCLLQILLVSLILYLTALVNFLPQDRFRKKVADCFLLKDNFIKGFLRGVLTTFLSSFFVAFSFVWIIFNAAASFEKITLTYFLTASGLTLLLYSTVGKFLLKETPKEVADYITFKWLPFVVTALTVIPYAVMFYFTVSVKELIPVADPQRYFNLLETRYSYFHCALFHHLAVWGDFLSYLAWSVVLSLSQISGQFFLLASFFLIIKGGFSAWVVARTTLGTLITLKNLKKDR